MKDMTGNPRNGCSGPGGREGAHTESRRRLGQDWDQSSSVGRSCGAVAAGTSSASGCRVIWGCSTCPALSPGEKAESRNLQPKWKLSRVLTEREFQILNQSKDTSRGVQGIGFRGAELVKQAKGSHHAGSIYCYWEEAVRV